MAEPSKQLNVLWDAGDWKRINEAAEALGAREHFDYTPTDIIRSGTRRFVDEILGPVPADVESVQAKAS